MAEDLSKPSLADDPAFQAGLDDLDRGLADSTVPPPARPLRRVATTPPSMRVPSALDVPIVLQPGTRRPLLDLFPTNLTAAPPPPAQRRRVIEPVEPVRPPAPRADETFYGFVEPPFGVEPDLRFLYHSVEHDRVMQQIVEAVARRDGLVVVTGAAGIGKTILCAAIRDQLDRRTLTSIVSAPVLSFGDLVKTLLADFGVVPREELEQVVESAERVEMLRSFLASLAALQANAVVIVDEARNLSADVLAALDGLAVQVPRTLQIILVGPPALTHLLERSELRVVNAHVAFRSTHGPLGADEVPGYVMHRVQIAAANPRIEFDDGAFARVFQVSLGVPRLVNQLCDRAVTRAFARSASVVDAAIIGAAAADLGLGSPDAQTEPIRPVTLAAGFVALMGVGAAAAVLVFWDRVQLILAAYR